MRENGESTQNHPETNDTKERMLTNPAFVRFARGFERYQDLLRQETIETKRSEITQRMNDLYLSRLRGPEDESQESSLNQEIPQIIQMTLQECQQGTFTQNDLAERIASSTVADKFLGEWNRRPDETEEGSGMIHVNEVIAYKEYGGELSLHIRPTGVGATELMSQITDGFRAIGVKMSRGEIKAETVVMKSWLFSGNMEKKAKRLFGEDVSIEDIPADDQDTVAIQYLALLYNTKSLERYLTTGERPEVKSVILSRDEFVTRFGKVQNFHRLTASMRHSTPFRSA